MGADNSLRENPTGFDELLEIESRERLAAAAAIVLVSGGFDPLHIGHVRMIEAAAKRGRVVVALNSDEWLFRKKGYFFMPWEERAEVLRALRAVYRVVAVDDQDNTVSDAIVAVRPTYFANGGDRTSPNEREHYFCRELGVKEIWGLGGGKVQSSSALVRRRAE